MAPRRPRFEIWQVGSTIHSVDSPVRLEILAWLEEGPRGLTELARRTKKAKSTLSALHMPSLLEAGLVEETRDDQDARARIYRLAGARLGSSAVPAARLRDAVLAYAQSRGSVPLPALIQVVDPLGLVHSGASAEYVAGVAARVGRSLGHMLTASADAAAILELDGVLNAAGVASVQRGKDGHTRVLAREPRLQKFYVKVVSEALAGRPQRPGEPHKR